MLGGEDDAGTRPPRQGTLPARQNRLLLSGPATLLRRLPLSRNFAPARRSLVAAPLEECSALTALPRGARRWA